MTNLEYVKKVSDFAMKEFESVDKDDKSSSALVTINQINQVGDVLNITTQRVNLNVSPAVADAALQRNWFDFRKEMLHTFGFFKMCYIAAVSVAHALKK